MLPRAAFAIFLAAVCRVSAQEALTDALPAPPAAIAAATPIKRVARSAPNDVAQFENRKKPRPGSKRSRFYPANSPKAVARRKAFFAFG